MALDVGPTSMSGQVGRAKLGPRPGGQNLAIASGGPSFSMDPGAMEQFKQKIPGGGFTGGMGAGMGGGIGRPQPRTMDYTPQIVPPGGGRGGGGMMGGMGRAMMPGGFGGAMRGMFGMGGGGNRGGIMKNVMGRGPMQGGGMQPGQINTGPSNQGNMVSGTPQAYSMVGGRAVPYGNAIDFYKTLMGRGQDIMDPNTFSNQNLANLGY